MAMNILLRGGGFSNKGDEAMMLTVQRELTKRLPGTNFLIWTNAKGLEKAHPYGLLAYGNSARWLRRGLRLASACTSDRDVRRALWLDWVTAEALSNLGAIDCVVDFSGFNYSDEWGATCAKRGLAWATYCNRNKKPFVCLPQAWGPFRIPAVADATRQLCKYSSLVYARDKVSLLLLKELLGADGNDVRIAPDIVFLFSGESPQVGREFLKSIGVNTRHSPLVGIAPNMRVYERCRGVGAENEYIQLMIRIAEHCIRTWGVSVILLPHEFSMHTIGKRDDRFLCGLIKVGVSDSDRCFTTRTYISTPLLKSVESQIDFMIGSRFHSLVFAISSGVPALALGWAHKYPELMELVGLVDNALIHTDFDEKHVMELLDKAWASRTELKARIIERLPEIREQVAEVFNDVAELLTGK